MCGLAGLLTNSDTGPWKDEWDAFKQLMVVTNLRGAHSTGIGMIKKEGKDLALLKDIGSIWDLWRNSEWSKFDYDCYREGKVFLGHGRAATVGDISVDNAHPFLIKEGEERLIMLTHNGTLYKTQQLPDFDKYPVDSKWIAHMLAEYPTDEVLSKIGGAMALMWFDTKDGYLHVFRNAERPLYMAKMPNKSVLFNSEVTALHWINSRLNLRIPDKDFLYFAPMTHYWFDLKTLEYDCKTVERKYETTHTHFFHGAHSRNTGTNGPTSVRTARGFLPVVNDEDYASLKTNMRLRQIYLDLFAGNVETAIFGAEGCRTTSNKGTVVTTIPGILSPKFYLIEIQHVKKDKIREILLLPNEGKVEVIKEFDDIFTDVVTYYGPQNNKKLVVGKKFKPNSKVRFSWPIKLNSRQTENIKNYAVTSYDSKHTFSIYGNDRDGTYYVGGLVAFEPFEAVESGMVGNKPLIKVTGSLLDAKTGSLVTIEWYCTTMESKEEVFRAGVWIGEVKRIMISTKEENAKYNDVVRFIVSNCVALEDCNQEITERYNRDSKMTYDALCKKASQIYEDIDEDEEGGSVATA